MTPRSFLRPRTLFLAGGCAIVLAALLLTDPDGGTATGVWLVGLSSALIGVAFAHVGRKALHDYPEADIRRLLAKASEHPIGAGLGAIAMAIVLSALLGLFGRSAHAAALDPARDIPAAAQQHLPTLRAQVDQAWPDHPRREALPALIEHESCITLTHPRCWSATSRLKTPREEGAGLGQITRAWRPDGTLRLDAIADMRARHADLRGLTWANVYTRPDLQMRAVVLMIRDNWQALRTISDPGERLAMADAAYNGGLGGVQRDRRGCQITPGCDPGRWWGHVERTCLASHAALYAGRSACDINRHHVRDVLITRAPKYRAAMAVRAA